MSEQVNITAGGFAFVGRLERQAAPRTCELFVAMLPLRCKLVQARLERPGSPYGSISFARSPARLLAELGERVLWQGAQDVAFELGDRVA